MTAEQVLAQRLMINDEATTQIEEQAPAAHLGELLDAEQTGVAGSAVDVQADRLGHLQQFIECLAATSVAKRQFVGDVVEVDPHAERLGNHRQLAAYVAVADNAEGSPSYLVRALGRLVPDAGVHLRVLVGEMPRERDDLGDHEFHHAPRVGEGRVEDGNAARGGGGEVDLVSPDAEGTDCLQVG